VKRVGLGLLFFAWLYGVPFLLIVGLIRRTSTPYAPTRADAHAYAATTDRILTWALILNAALVFAGLLLSRLTADDAWWRRFMWSIAWMMGVYVAVSLAAAQATAPLIGHVPDSDEPQPRITQCIPISGGTGCPGG